MKERNKLIIAIVAVAVIIVSVGGGTYAFFTWVTNTSQRTNVSFTVNQTTIEGDLNAQIVGNANASSLDATLKPASCTSSGNAIIKTVPITYYNSTVQAATVTATLKVTAFNLRSASYKPTSTDLGYLKYALTESSTNCTTSAVQTGTFSGITFSGAAGSNLPYTLFDQTITAPANMSEAVTKTYYLWIWLDSTYSHQNEGSVNSDPMQGFTINVEWSGTIAQNNS